MVRISPTEVAVADISSFREIHKTSTAFTKADWYRGQDPTQLNEESIGIFGTESNKLHAERKRLMAPGFSKTAILRWEPHIKKTIALAVQKIERDAKTGTADILQWWTWMTADIFGELGFGQPFGLLVNEKVACDQSPVLEQADIPIRKLHILPTSRPP